MAMPQRDNYIDDLYKTEGLLQYAQMQGDEAEVERLRAKLERLSNMGDNDVVQCRPVWNGKN